MTSKRSGPSFKQETRPLAKCTPCKGKGTTQGVFYEIPCHQCAGSGIVDKETGEQLPQDELVLQLRIRLNEKIQENSMLRSELQELRNEASNDRGYGHMGKRYHGD